MVAGDRAARPCVPTVLPTKALSILDKRGLERYIPNAGKAKPSMLRFDIDDDLVVVSAIVVLVTGLSPSYIEDADIPSLAEDAMSLVTLKGRGDRMNEGGPICGVRGFPHRWTFDRTGSSGSTTITRWPKNKNTPSSTMSCDRRRCIECYRSVSTMRFWIMVRGVDFDLIGNSFVLQSTVPVVTLKKIHRGF